MSERNRPNFHAVGFMIDVIAAFKARLRGPAKEHEDEAMLIILRDAKDWADGISDELDDRFGRPKK